jgi:hypothetical protein
MILFRQLVIPLKAVERNLGVVIRRSATLSGIKVRLCS